MLTILADGGHNARVILSIMKMNKKLVTILADGIPLTMKIKIVTILADSRHDEDVAVEEDPGDKEEEPKHLNKYDSDNKS